MAPVPAFGFSAFMRMLFLNEKPQRTLIRNRLLPTKKSGRDFHKTLRQGAHALVVENKPFIDVIKSMQTIKKEAERLSASNGLEKLATWVAIQNSEVLDFGDVIYESPNAKFRVRFSPDFGLDINGRHTAIHLWNNKATLIRSITLAALSLHKDGYAAISGGPDDWAVLSLRDSTLHRWSESDVEHVKLAALFVGNLEKTFSNVRQEIAKIGPSISEYPDKYPDEDF